MATHAVSVRQRLVGWCLREHRENAGYRLEDAARILECHPSGISRIEAGQRSIRRRDMHELLDAYGADPAVEEALTALARPRRGADGWWSEYGGQLPAPYVDLVSAEAVSSQIAVYAPLEVPALLQTPGYACAAAAADATVSEEHKPAVVAAALGRQRVTLEENTAAVTVVIGEAVLRQRTGGPTVMRDQLAYLAGLPDHHPHVTVRLLPFSTGTPPAGGAGGFTVLQFANVRDLGLVHLDGPAGGLFPEDRASTAVYLSAFARLQGHALSPENSSNRLWQLTRGQ
jgi:transcriptional regulator with XRE-family HTH domain